MRETDLVRECLEWLRLRGVLAWRQNVGAVCNDYKGKKRFVRFLRTGMADIGGILPGGRALQVECKRPGKEPTAAQERFLLLVAQQGGCALVVHSLDELIEGLPE